MCAFIPSSSPATVAGRRLRRRTGPPPLSSLRLSPSNDAFALAAASSADAAAPLLPSGEAFEAMIPDATLLVGFVGLVVLCAVATVVWAEQVVPVSRANLAVSKRRGPVKEYLDDLRESEKSVSVEKVGANQTDISSTAAPLDVTTNNATTTRGDRSFERWLFTDWLRKPVGRARSGRQKDPAIPVLKDAKWNSGDNPVLVASALIGIAVLASSLAERVTLLANSM